jgi:hypothetical protein
LAPIKPNQKKSIKSVPEFYTLSDTTALRLNQDYLQQVDLEIKIKKNKKKRAKVSSGYSKKQVQALRVLKKISTHTFSKQPLFLPLNSFFYDTHRVVFFSKKLAFLKPSTSTTGFLFFLFSFEMIILRFQLKKFKISEKKFYVRSVAKHVHFKPKP